MGIEQAAPEEAIFLEPGVTPEKTRALVRKIWQITHEESDRETMLNNLCFLCGVACSYLLTYAKDSVPEGQQLKVEKET